MVFDLVPAAEIIPGMQVWGAIEGDRQYVISFDNRFPDRGYKCSYKPHGDREAEVVYLPDQYPSFSAAIAACERVLKTLH